MKGVKNKLVNAHILLQCDDKNHKICGKLQDKLMTTFNEVKESDIITTNNSIDFCVYGVAKIDPSKKDLFVNALRSLKPNSKKVKNVKVYLEAM